MSNLINKRIPDPLQLKSTVIADVINDAEVYVNDHVDLINGINDNYLLYLDTIASYINKAASDLSVNTNLLADLFVTSGKTNTSASLLDKLKVFSNSGTVVDLNDYSVKIENKSYNTNTIQSKYALTGVKILPGVGQVSADFNLGNTKEFTTKKYYEIDNIISATDRLEVEALNKQLSFVIELDLGSNKMVNNLGFNLFNVGGSLFPNIAIKGAPEGGSFKETTIYGLSRLNLNNVNLDATQTVNAVSLDINQFFVRYIRIEVNQINFYVPKNFAQVRRFAVSLNNLSVGFSQPVDTGSVILGPLTTNSEILKASVSADVTNYNPNDINVIFEVTNDINSGTYYRVLNSKETTLDNDLTKVVNFNNIAFNSITTPAPVKELYLRITLNSLKEKTSLTALMSLKDLEKFNKRYRAIFSTENDTFSTGAVIDPEKVSVLKIIGSRSGLHDHTLDVADIKTEYYDLKKDGVYLKSITGQEDKVKASSQREKLLLNLDDTYGGVTEWDIDKYNTKVVSVSSAFVKAENIESKFKDGYYTWKPAKNFEVTLKPSIPEGKYILKHNDKTIEITVHSHHNSVTYFNRLVTDLGTYSLYNEIGEKIADIQAHETAGVKYVSMLEAFPYETSTVTGYTFNSTFPFTPIGDTEFTITSEGLVFSKNVLGRHNLLLVNVAPEEFTTAKLISGQDKIKIETPKLAQISYKLEGGSYKNIYKLKHKSILGQSIKFDITDAAVNTFLKEVGYINGKTEFDIPEVYVTGNNYGLNTIELHQGFVEDLNENIFFEEESPTRQFTDRVYTRLELISEGQWLLEFNEGTQRWNIVLPDGITVPTDADVRISYNIRSEETVSSGLYSIDYKNGIVYTSSPIDDRIEITYLYTNVFVEYEHFRLLTSEQADIDENGVTINDIGLLAEEASCLILEETAPAEEIEYSTSPKVSEIKLNIVTKNEVF